MSELLSTPSHYLAIRGKVVGAFLTNTVTPANFVQPKNIYAIYTQKNNPNKLIIDESQMRWDSAENKIAVYWTQEQDLLFDHEQLINVQVRGRLGDSIFSSNVVGIKIPLLLKGDVLDEC